MRKEERRRKLTIETRNLNKRTRTIQYYISHTQHIYRIYHA